MPGKNDRLESSVLIVDDDANFLNTIKVMLYSNNINNVTSLTDSSEIFRELSKKNYSVILLDWVMPGFSGADLLPQLVSQFPHIPVIIMTAVVEAENIVSCIKQGAFDYITKPPEETRLIASINSAMAYSELSDQNRRLTDYLLGQQLENPEIFSEFITCNEKMYSKFKIIETMAPTRQPVLITGETGVGKELIAHMIHKASGVKGRFVPLNAAGLDDSMLTDTLFGHKRGAYTHASDSREGLIEVAKGGTLFLDEIGDLSIQSQMKLLRLIQQKEYYRLGSDVLQKSDARIIAASNCDFNELMANKTFRADLYHRISAHQLHIEPLRKRREDILPLVKHYIEDSARQLDKEPPKLSREARFSLQAYNFPGNVRELINKINHAVTYNNTGILTLDDFPGLALSGKVPREILRKLGNGKFGLCGIFSEFPTIDEVDELLVDEAMTMAKNNRSTAANLLGISRQTLQRKFLERTPEID